MNKKSLLIDHDGTITYFDKPSGKWNYKEGLVDFLIYIVKNFEVQWCSGCEHEDILFGLREFGIDEDILKSIGYFEYDAAHEKAKSIVENTKEFIFIDDDGWNEEYLFLKRKGLEDIFIKAQSREEKDLYRIKKLLEKVV